MLVESEVENDVEPDEFSDCVESLEDPSGGQQGEGSRPIISLHALSGTDGFQTMRIHGHVKNQKLVILIDTGSTHNFVDQTVIKRVGGHLQAISNFMVTVANGEKIKGARILLWIAVRCSRRVSSGRFFCLALTGM